MRAEEAIHRQYPNQPEVWFYSRLTFGIFLKNTIKEHMLIGNFNVESEEVRAERGLSGPHFYRWLNRSLDTKLQRRLGDSRLA